MEMDVGYAGDVAEGVSLPKIMKDDVQGGGADHTVSTGVEYLAGAQGGIRSLMPHDDSEGEVSLADDDVAFCLRSMFAEQG